VNDIKHTFQHNNVINNNPLPHELTWNLKSSFACSAG